MNNYSLNRSIAITIMSILFFNSFGLFAQNFSLDIPNTGVGLDKSQVKGMFSTEFYGINEYYGFKTLEGYIILKDGWVTKLDKNRNILSVAQIEGPQKTKRSQPYTFYSFLFYKNSSYILYTYPEEGQTAFVAYQYSIGKESIDLNKPIYFNGISGDKIYAKGKNNSYYLYSYEFVKNKCTVNYIELSEKITGTEKNQTFEITIPINPKNPKKENSFVIDKLQFDVENNIHYIVLESITIDANNEIYTYNAYYGKYNVTTKTNKVTPIGDSQLNKQIGTGLGFDKIGNSYVLMTGSKTNGVYNHDSFRLFKFNSGTEMVNSTFVSVDNDSRLRFNFIAPLYSRKEKGQEEINTNAIMDDIPFSISEDGTVCTFQIKESERVITSGNGRGGGPDFYLLKSFHLLAFNPTTLKTNLLTIGRSISIADKRILEDCFIQGQSTTNLLFYNNEQNFNLDMSNVEVKKLSKKENFDPKEFKLYAVEIDNNLTFKTQLIKSPTLEAVNILPVIEFPDKEYLIFNSEDLKFKNIRVGVLNFKK